MASETLARFVKLVGSAHIVRLIELLTGSGTSGRI
jgi:hypothetical protein